MYYNTINGEISMKTTTFTFEKDGGWSSEDAAIAEVHAIFDTRANDHKAAVENLKSAGELIIAEISINDELKVATMTIEATDNAIAILNAQDNQMIWPASIDFTRGHWA